MPLTLPTGDDAAALADWSELYLLTRDASGLSARTLDMLLRGEASDAAEEELAADRLREEEEEEEEEEDRAEIEIEDFDLRDEGEAERDIRVEQLFGEIELRLRIGPRLYPFEVVDEQIVEREAVGKPVYLLLLILSTGEASYRDERRAHEVEAIFDSIALTAIRQFLGPNAVGVRFARNSHDPEDESTRPALFSEAIKWLRDRMDLRPGVRRPEDDDEDATTHWEFEDGPADDARQPLNTYKDAGVDVVVWRRFADGRRGFPALLAQCTVQLAWQDKVSDVKIELWMKWIDFDTVPPQKALVIPFAVNREDPRWDDRTVSAGIIVDRLRTLELLNDLSDEALAALIDEATTEWIQRELISLR
jgi:hypothetical protein